MEKNIYDKTEMALIVEHNDAIKKGIIEPTTIDLEKKNINKKYNTWLDKLSELNPKEYDVSTMKKINEKLVLGISLEIITKIFNESIVNIFLEYINTIEITNQNQILDGMVLNIGDINRNSVGIVTFLPNIEYLSSVLIILHEFIHYLSLKFDIEPKKKRYYREILSLYIEKYALNYLSVQFNDKDLLKKCESTRIESIIWHYKEHPNEIKYIIDEYKKLKRNLNSKEDYDFVKFLEINIPWIKTQEGIMDMYKYKQCLRDSYGIGYLFGDALYRKFLEDENIFKKEINSIISKEKTLEEVLTYYDISTSNFKIYDESYAYLKKVLK